MCIIIDADMFGVYCAADNPALGPVRKWVDNGGKVVYTNVGQYGDELKRCGRMMDMIEKIGGQREFGNLKLVKSKDLNAQMSALKKTKLKSNDRHIIALAKAGGVTLLVTEDGALMDDFKSQIRKGKIFKPGTPESTIQRHQCGPK